MWEKLKELFTYMFQFSTGLDLMVTKRVCVCVLVCVCGCPCKHLYASVDNLKNACVAFQVQFVDAAG